MKMPRKNHFEILGYKGKKKQKVGIFLGSRSFVDSSVILFNKNFGLRCF